jgi:hypothetical protein
VAKTKKWIQGAIKHPGALRAKAKRAGALKPDGTIKVAWLQDKSKESDTTGRQARLALKLKKMPKRGR